MKHYEKPTMESIEIRVNERIAGNQSTDFGTQANGYGGFYFTNPNHKGGIWVFFMSCS